MRLLDCGVSTAAEEPAADEPGSCWPASPGWTGLAAGGSLVTVVDGWGVSTVRLPDGKNEPPEMSVAMMPAITAISATPINRSGQLRLSQSMVPILPASRDRWRGHEVEPAASLAVL